MIRRTWADKMFWRGLEGGGSLQAPMPSAQRDRDRDLAKLTKAIADLPPEQQAAHKLIIGILKGDTA